MRPPHWTGQHGGQGGPQGSGGLRKGALPRLHARGRGWRGHLLVAGWARDGGSLWFCVDRRRAGEASGETHSPNMIGWRQCNHAAPTQGRFVSKPHKPALVHLLCILVGGALVVVCVFIIPHGPTHQSSSRDAQSVSQSPQPVADVDANANALALHLIQGDRVEQTWKRRCKPNRPPPAPCPPPSPAHARGAMHRYRHRRRHRHRHRHRHWIVPAIQTCRAECWSISQPLFQPGTFPGLGTSSLARIVAHASQCWSVLTASTTVPGPLNHHVRLPPDVHAAKWIPDCQATATP